MAMPSQKVIEGRPADSAMIARMQKDKAPRVVEGIWHAGRYSMRVWIWETSAGRGYTYRRLSNGKIGSSWTECDLTSSSFEIVAGGATLEA